jgi:hypothetical protein
MKRLVRLGLAAGLVGGMSGIFFLGPTPGSAAPACIPSAAVHYDPHPGVTIVQTSFEQGTLANFVPAAAGTGTVSLSSDQRRSGGCSAHLHVTADAGSLANMSSPALPAGSRDVYADGWFNVTTAGLFHNDVPYFRFFNGPVRVMDVLRDNIDGQMWLRIAAPDNTFTYTRLGRVAGLGAWHHLVLHAVADGPASTVDVWFDDLLLYSSSTVSTAATGLTSVQIGAEHARQMGDTYLDDVSITAS